MRQEKKTGKNEEAQAQEKAQENATQKVVDFMDDTGKARVSLGIHVAIAAAVGWLSVGIASSYRSLYAAVLGFAILYATGFIVQKATRQKGLKWWVSNGLALYLFVWFISWTLFYNLSLA